MTTSISTTRRTGKHRKGTRFTEEERREYRRAKSEKVMELASLIGKLNTVKRAELLKRIGAVVTIDGHALSQFNTMFCWYQRHELGQLSVVGGYQQWRKAGRNVRRGEKGMMMLFPMFIERNDANGEPLMKENGEKDILTRFNVGTVFDITQTYPAYHEPVCASDELGNGEVIDVESEVTK